MDEIITPSVTDGENVTPAEGVGADSPPLRLKDVLGQALGKEFKDDQTALKSVKDTFNFVGEAGKYKKVVEAQGLMHLVNPSQAQTTPKMDEQATPAQPATPAPVQSDVAAEVAALKAQVAEKEFYDEHPEYKAHRALISSLGKNPAEVVATEVFKNTFEALQAAEESKKSKSVLHSNPRIAAASDKVQKSREELKAGNANAAVAAALEAVNEAYGK